MTPAMVVEKIGHAVTVQDGGWDGTLAMGLSRGGAADTRALAEAWALIGEHGTAVLEMAGMGGRFKILAPVRIALSGAPMGATLDNVPLLWNGVHSVSTGQTLEIGPASTGVYGYLAIGGGFMTPRFFGSASTHRGAGLGHVVQVGDTLAMGTDTKADRVGLVLPRASQNATPIRVVATAHTELFSQKMRDTFEETTFTRSARGNRQGVGLDADTSFALEGGQSIPSETVIPGDIQVPGQGSPFALLADSQTTGGYPRIAAILPCDVARVAQAIAGTQLRFNFVSREDGIAAELAERKQRAGLGARCLPILRDPMHMQDLLSYQLVSGAISGDEQ